MSRRQAVATAALLTVAALSAGCAAADTPAAGERPASAPGVSAVSPSATPAASPAAVAQRVGSVLPEDPVSITLPTGRTVPIRSVSTTANGVLDVPENIDAAGWWRGGSRIGDPFGSTLVAAHVDSATQGLGPFAELLEVPPGATVTLRTQGLEQAFRVRSLRLRPKGSIAPTSSLHSPEGARRLTLVTCAGPYVRELGGYQNLAVVVAAPVGDPVPRSGR